jgi:hypothetical protein
MLWIRIGGSEIVGMVRICIWIANIKLWIRIWIQIRSKYYIDKHEFNFQEWRKSSMSDKPR